MKSNNPIAILTILVGVMILLNGCGSSPTAPVVVKEPLTGKLVGYVLVRYQGGDSVPSMAGVKVTVIGTKTYTAMTNDTGSYSIDNVDAGVYSATFEHTLPNFNTFKIKQFQFVGNGTYTVDQAYITGTLPPPKRLTFRVSQRNEFEQGIPNPTWDGVIVDIKTPSGTQHYENEKTIVIENPADGWYEMVTRKDGFIKDSVAVRYPTATSISASLMQKPQYTVTLTVDSLVKIMRDNGAGITHIYTFARVRATVAPYLKGNFAGLYLVVRGDTLSLPAFVKEQGQYDPFGYRRSSNNIFDSDMRTSCYCTDSFSFELYLKPNDIMYISAFAVPEKFLGWRPMRQDALGRISNTIGVDTH